MRMLRTLAKIDWKTAGKSLFVTLTYPDEVAEGNNEQRTRHRAEYLRQVEKFVGRKVAALWRIEWKPRLQGNRVGELTAHHHLVILGVSSLPWRAAHRWWQEAIGSTGKAHVWLRHLPAAKAAALYASKYAAKEAALGKLAYGSYLQKLGRAWGIARRNLVPFHTEARFDDLESDQVFAALQIAAEELGKMYPGPFYLLSSVAKSHAAKIVGIRTDDLDKLLGGSVNSKDQEGTGRQRQSRHHE